MHVHVLADLPGYSVATTSTFENELLEMVFQLLEETVTY